MHAAYKYYGSSMQVACEQYTSSLRFFPGCCPGGYVGHQECDCHGCLVFLAVFACGCLLHFSHRIHQVNVTSLHFHGISNAHESCWAVVLFGCALHFCCLIDAGLRVDVLSAQPCGACRPVPAETRDSPDCGGRLCARSRPDRRSISSSFNRRETASPTHLAGPPVSD